MKYCSSTIFFLRNVKHRRGGGGVNSLAGKVNFCTGTGRKAFFRIFFGLILDPPPVHMLLHRKKANSFVPAIFSPLHGHFRKKGGLVPVYVFLFPLWGSQSELNDLYLSLSYSLQNGIRTTTTLTCGWVGSKGFSYQLNSPERQGANYTTFTFACSIYSSGISMAIIGGSIAPHSSKTLHRTFLRK